MKFLRDSLISFAGQWFILILTLAINVFVARWLGPDGKGVYTLLTVFASLIILVTNFGLSRSAIYFVGKEVCTLEQATNNLLTLTFLIGGFATIGLLLFFQFYPENIFEEIPNLYLVIVSFAAVFLLGRLVVADLFAAVEDFTWSNLVLLMDLGFRIIFIGLLFFVGFEQDGLPWVILLGAIATVLISWGNLYRRLPNGLRFEFDGQLVGKFFSYGLRAYSYALTSFLNLRLDQFLVGLFLSIGQVGIYSVSVAVAELSMKAAKAMSAVLFPRISALSADRANHLTGVTVRLTILLAVVLCVFLALLGRYIIALLFGDAFDQAYRPLLILLPGVIAFNILQLLNTDLAGRGKPEIGTFTTILGLVVTVIGNLTLTPRIGIEGAAWTSTVAYSLSMLFTVYMFQKTSGQSLTELFVIRKSDIMTLLSLGQRLREQLQVKLGK